ncbi:hypothetical protein V8D89_013364 [Ganoderma adspersum]
MDGSSPALPLHPSPQSRHAGRGLRCPGCEGEDAITRLIDSDGESPALQVDRYQDRRPMFVGFGMGKRDTSRSHGGRYRGLDDLRVIMQEGSTTTKDTRPSTPTRDDIRPRSPAGRLGHVRSLVFVLALGLSISRKHSRRGLPEVLSRLWSPAVLARPPSRVRSERILAQILLGWLCLCPAASRRSLSGSPPTDSSTPCLHLPHGASSSACAESSMRKKNARLRTLISRATHPRPRTEIALSPVGWYGHRPTSLLCGGPGSHFRHLQPLGPRENVAGCDGMTGRDPPSAVSGMSGLPSGAGTLAVRLARAVEVCPSSCHVSGRRLLRLILHPVSGPIASRHCVPPGSVWLSDSRWTACYPIAHSSIYSILPRALAWVLVRPRYSPPLDLARGLLLLALGKRRCCTAASVLRGPAEDIARNCHRRPFSDSRSSAPSSLPEIASLAPALVSLQLMRKKNAPVSFAFTRSLPERLLCTVPRSSRPTAPAHWEVVVECVLRRLSNALQKSPAEAVVRKWCLRRVFSTSAKLHC